MQIEGNLKKAGLCSLLVAAGGATIGGIGYAACGIIGGSWLAAEIGGYVGVGLGMLLYAAASETEFSPRIREDEEYERYFRSCPPKKENTPKLLEEKISSLEKNLRSKEGEASEDARSELRHLHANAQWYSARYAASVAFGASKKQIETELELWVYKIQQKLKETVKKKESVVVEWAEEEVYPCSCGDDNRGGPCGTRHVPSKYKEIEVDVPNIPLGLSCILDLGALLRMSGSRKVKKVLMNEFQKNKSYFLRNQAGKALGYSRLRVMANQFKVIASTACASAMALSAYELISYLR